MADGRKDNRGNGRGRPSKAEEFKAYERGMYAIKEQYGSEAKFWKMIAGKAGDSFPHLKVLLEYTYGKAPDKLTINTNARILTVPEWFNSKNGEEQAES